MARRSNREILAAAQCGIVAFADIVRENERDDGIRRLALHLVSEENDGTMPANLQCYRHLHRGHPWFNEALAQARDSAIFRMWAQSKVVYAMDDDLLGYLAQSSASGVPTEILRNLPHANPYVLLPKPDLDDPDTVPYLTRIGVPLGAFVFGRYRNAELLCSTNCDRREDLGLMFLGVLESEEGPALQTTRCTVPLRERMLTVEGIVDATVARFTFNEHLAEDDRSQFKAWLRRYVAQVFASLVYICTDQPDTETYRPGVNRAGKLKKSGRRQQQRPRLSDISEVVQLGFRMGPALLQARRQWEREHEPGATGAGGRQRPHQRRGHFRTYWTGPRRQVPKVNWVAPYWVSQDLLGKEAQLKDVTVRRINKRP